MSGGIAAALAGYFLLLQAFVASLTCGMTVPVEGGPQFVLCQPSLVLAASASPDSDGEEPEAFVHECPCVVCNGTEFALPAAEAPGADLGPAFVLASGIDFPVEVRRLPAPDPSRLGLAPDPRGPPSLSA